VYVWSNLVVLGILSPTERFERQVLGAWKLAVSAFKNVVQGWPSNRAQQLGSEFKRCQTLAGPNWQLGWACKLSLAPWLRVSRAELSAGNTGKYLTKKRRMS
jgi:hypothetical protein